jgi:chaperonin GroES
MKLSGTSDKSKSLPVTFVNSHFISNLYNRDYLIIINSSKNMKKDISKKIKPLADRVLIKEDTSSKEKKTSSGIIIPISAQEDKGGKRGEIVAVGAGRTEDGKLIPVSVKVGDIVLFQWGDKVRIDDEDFYIVKESEILAVIK